MTAPHETDRFANAATYTVAVTYTVAGGARRETAHRRVRVVAERVTAAAARLADVVEASAVVGIPDPDGQLLVPRTVHFAGANTGRGTYLDGDKLDRYVDADHERGLVSLSAVNTAQRERRRADRARRQAIGCRTSGYQLLDGGDVSCKCVYCQPSRHLDLLTDPTATAAWTARSPLEAVCLASSFRACSVIAQIARDLRDRPGIPVDHRHVHARLCELTRRRQADRAGPRSGEW